MLIVTLDRYWRITAPNPGYEMQLTFDIHYGLWHQCQSGTTSMQGKWKSNQSEIISFSSSMSNLQLSYHNVATGIAWKTNPYGFWVYIRTSCKFHRSLVD